MINKLPIKKLVEFRRFSEKRQVTFANNLRIPKVANPDDSSGGDYWIRSLSGLSNAFKENDCSIINEKIDGLSSDYDATKIKKTKIMYQRNLEILHNYEDFDFSIWRPDDKLKFLSKPRTLLSIKNIPIQIIPHHVFAYGKEEKQSVGGICFVTWLEGFKRGDLGIFSDALFRYLSIHYSEDYHIDPDFCLIVDAANQQTVRYSQILKGEIPPLLDNTVDIINKYLN